MTCPELARACPLPTELPDVALDDQRVQLGDVSAARARRRRRLPKIVLVHRRVEIEVDRSPPPVLEDQTAAGTLDQDLLRRRRHDPAPNARSRAAVAFSSCRARSNRSAYTSNVID